MPRTTLSDVFIPEVFASYQIEDPVEKTVFVDSGAVVQSAYFDQLANGAGRITTMPFWRPLDTTVEPNYDNDVYTDIAEPQKVTSDEMQVRVADLNEGWSSADLVVPLSRQEPLRYVSAQVDDYWRKQFQRRTIASLVGVYNDNVANDSSDMVVDIGEADIATVTDDMRFGGAAAIDAEATMGDMLGEISIIAVHSIVYNRMRKLDLIEYLPDSEGKPSISTYMGRRVVVDDGLPVLAGSGTNPQLRYVSIFMGPGIIGYGNGRPHTPFETEREAARGNGGGFETLWVRKRWLVHPFGFSFTSNTITGPGLAPTWADLRLAANWDRLVADRKQIPLAFLVTNA